MISSFCVAVSVGICAAAIILFELSNPGAIIALAVVCPVVLSLPITYIFYSLLALNERKQRELEQANARLAESLADVRELSGLLPICASCKSIRDDSGYWNQLEAYLKAHSRADFSHGLCPDCVAKHYPEFASRRSRQDERGMDGGSTQ